LQHLLQSRFGLILLLLGGLGVFEVGSTSAGPTLTATATPAGIAARYPGDKNIALDPDVIFADDFESYSSASDLTNKWNNVHQFKNTRIATEPDNVFAGGKSLEFTLPISTTETANAAEKVINPPLDTVFFRTYTKFDTDYHVVGSNHNGIRLSAKYPGPGSPAPADGIGFFLFHLQNNIQGSGRPGETDPGYCHIYAYWPYQRSNYGDHWYPDGFVVPYDVGLGADGQVIGNRGDWLAFPNNYPDFKPMPNWLPERGRWYCYELMVKANTPGKNDGEVKYWIDGNLVSDFPNLNMRSIASLQIDDAVLVLHAIHSEQVNKEWYDNVVVAKSYIGPMAGVTPTPTPSPTASPSATPTPSPTPTPTPSPLPTPTPTPSATPNPKPTAIPSPSLSGLILFRDGVEIGPFQNATLTFGLTYTVRANAGVNVALVRFYRNGSFRNDDRIPPFETRWTPHLIGSHVFRATPYNNNGVAGPSITTTYTVVAP
jgi:hypothetical protein